MTGSNTQLLGELIRAAGENAKAEQLQHPKRISDTRKRLARARAAVEERMQS